MNPALAPPNQSHMSLGGSGSFPTNGLNMPPALSGPGFMQAPPPMPAHLQGSLPQAPPAFMHHQPPPPLNHGLAPHPGQAPPQAQPQQAIGPRPGFFNPISSPFMFGPAPPPPSGLGMPPHHQHPLNHSSLNEHQNTTYYFPSANTASSSSSSSSNAQSSNNNNGGNSNKSKSSIGNQNKRNEGKLN